MLLAVFYPQVSGEKSSKLYSSGSNEKQSYHPSEKKKKYVDLSNIELTESSAVKFILN